MKVKSIAAISLTALLLQTQFSWSQTGSAAATLLTKYGLTEKNVKAQISLGEKLVKGQGTPKNPVDGKALLELAAQTNDGAKLMLANMMIAGTDLTIDVPRGISMLDELALRDNKSALNTLAGIYLDDKTAPPNAEKATAYLQKSIALGDMAAQTRLGSALIKGQVLPKNASGGQALLETAAPKFVGAKVALANFIIAGIDLPKDASRGITLLEEAAATKNPAALNALATIYLEGTAAPADPMKARAFLNAAMALSDQTAQIKLATALIKGQGLPQNKEFGLSYLLDAARKNVGAKVTLGNFLIAGTDIPKDTTQGISLLQEAAAANNPGAIMTLASIYLDGTAAPADPGKARSYLNQAISLNIPSAEIKLATSLIKGKGLPKETGIGLSYLESAAAKNVSAKVALANLLVAGTDIPKNVTRGISLLEEAAATNNASAMSSLASVLLDGTAVSPDPARARALLDNAIALGDVASQIKLANALIKGSGLPKDAILGAKLLEEAATKNVGAKTALGNYLISGLDLPKDGKRGIVLLEQAAALDNVGAIASLAAIYLDGTAAPQNPQLASNYLNKAIALGDVGSQIKLANALIKGQGLTRNTSQGMALLEQAAKTNISAKLTYGRYLLAGDFVKQDVPLASKILNEVSAAGNAGGWDALGTFYLFKSKDKQRETLAINYLTKAGNAGNGASWATLASGIAAKKLPRSKFGFDYYAKKARAFPNTSIEVISAGRHIWGNGVQKSKKTAIRILETGAANGNVPAMRNLIQIFRNGMLPAFGKNLNTAAIYLQRYSGKLTADQIAVENFLLRIATATKLADYQRELASPENQAFFKRADVQNNIFAANRRFMVYRAQAGLKRGGIFKGTLDGSATKATFAAMNQGCKILGNCGPIKLTADNLFHLANRW
jgi:uncharacterized protein